MKQAKKFIVVPYNPGYNTSVIDKKLLDLDEQINKVLYNKSLTYSEKINLYNETLSKFLQLKIDSNKQTQNLNNFDNQILNNNNEIKSELLNENDKIDSLDKKVNEILGFVIKIFEKKYKNNDIKTENNKIIETENQILDKTEDIKNNELTNDVINEQENNYEDEYTDTEYEEFSEEDEENEEEFNKNISQNESILSNMDESDNYQPNQYLNHKLHTIPEEPINPIITKGIKTTSEDITRKQKRKKNDISLNVSNSEKKKVKFKRLTKEVDNNNIIENQRNRTTPKINEYKLNLLLNSGQYTQYYQ